MASSSSPSDLSTKHDVFLSFRGTDTRHNFISHLAKDLRNKKIQTFTDDDELKRGDEISPTLMSAIEQSKISIIIFSENYADSKWCLEELLKILECRNALNQIVIPVFYNVDPTHVRHQTGKFGTAFDRLLKNIAASIYPNLILRILLPFLPKEQIWRDALKEAANLSGFHALNNGSEATLIETIIADVLEKLKTGSRNAFDDMVLVGINSRMDEIIRLLRTESPEVRMVGIWGMGGIGKTTIAEAVFNKLSSEFQTSCFLENVREKAGKKDALRTIRDKLISKLLKEEKLEIDTPHIGNESTKERLRRTKVLVVLDDVDNSSQLEELIGAHGTNQFGEGSRIIVTTRDKHVLEAHDITCVYDMQMLDDTEALELFRFYAFRQNQPIEPYLEISKKIVEYAEGVPLALKVLGSSLRGKMDIRDWEGELKKLKKLPNMEISNVLKTSYDGLTQEEKDIFLDIVCFFKRGNIHEVRKVLDSLYVSSHSGMNVLFDKSLITPTGIFWESYTLFCNNVESSIRLPFEPKNLDSIEMHDLIEEMGRNIVNEETKKAGSPSRLWRFEDVYDVLTRNTGTDKIKAIRFYSRGKKQMNLDPQVFAKMHNLKFLRIEDFSDQLIEFPSGLESLPEGLRYLQWQGYPLQYLPSTFNPTNLVQLYLSHSPLKRLWSGKQNLRNLKVLNLESCYNLVEIPDLSLATNLEELNVLDCRSLDKISSSVQHCRSLRYLHLKGCYKDNPSFMHLSYNTRLNLNFLPSSLQYLTNLTRLKLISSDLTEIPSSIQYLTSLTCLDLSYTLLKEVPSFIQHLTNLKNLYLDSCYSLTKISSSIQHLSNLKHLNLEFCYSLTEISFIQHLTNLTHLYIAGCRGLTENISTTLLLRAQKIFCPNLPKYIIQNIISGCGDLTENISTTLHLSAQSNNYPNLPKNIKLLSVDKIFTKVYPSSVALLTNLVELRVLNCSHLSNKSSNCYKELELLTPEGCYIG